MEPQNKKERSKVIYRFLLLFIVGILLVTIPFYFTLRLPGSENKAVSEELQKLQDQAGFEKDFFAVRVDSVKQLFDGYDSKEVDIDKLNADIGFILSEMENSIASDTTWRHDMYEDIIQTFLSIKKNRNSLIKVTGDLAKCRGSLRSSRPSRPSDSLDPI